MSKKLDEIDPAEGPFRVPESAFPEAKFTDEDVKRAMADEPSYVTEGEPEYPRPEAPPPPPPPPDQRWMNDDDAVQEPKGAKLPPPPATPVPARASRPPPAMESSGLVMEIGSEPAPAKRSVAPPADVAGAAMNYMALGIFAVLIGMGGAGLVLAMYLALSGDPEVTSTHEGETVGNIQVRKTLNAPPKPNLMEENIQEFEEREAGEVPPAPPAPPAPVILPGAEPPAPPSEPKNDAPAIGSQLP